MNKLITLIAVMALSFSVTNCGKKNNGGGGAVAPDSARTSNASEIQFDDGNSNPIIWSSLNGNIFVNTSANCFEGISSSADDVTFQAIQQKLMDLVNSSTVSKGTKDSVSSRSIYLNIRYGNGEVKTFNLVAEEASVDEEVLSNGGQIIEFFNNVKVEIDQKGIRSCRTGK